MGKIYIISQELFYDRNNIKLFSNLVHQSGSSFIIDSSLQKEVQRLIKSTIQPTDYLFIEAINAFLQLPNTTSVDMDGLLKIDAVEKIIRDNLKDEVFMITSKTQIFRAYKDQLTSFKSFHIVSISDMVLKEWKQEIEPNTPAFYLTDDSEFITRIDTDELKYVYSPRFGYLSINGSKLYEGGEGSIYKTYNNRLCKIFKKQHITYVNYLKLNQMLQIDVYNPFVVWPEDILFYQGQFVGYLMPLVEDAKSLDELRDTGFQGMSILNRIEIGLSFLKIIDYLHQKGIVIGDMKFDNILVRNSQEVFLIDTGSFQILDYPCTVFNAEFTGRKMTTKDLKERLRTVEDDYFPIYKILFEIIILKNPFYSPDTPEIDANAPRVFHYPLGEPKANLKISKDMAIWLNLSQRLKEYFYYYFAKNQITYLPELIKEVESFIKTVRSSMQGGN